MNFLKKYTKQIAQMGKYQEWAHDNGLYSTIRVEVINRGKKERHQKDAEGKIDWSKPQTMQDGEEEVLFRFGCQPESYTNVKAFMKEFGIKKMGKDASYEETEMDFETEHQGVNIKLYAVSELGPRCKVVYEDVVVPASKELVIKAKPEHTKKVAKIVCN